MQKQVLIIDDHPLVHTCLRELFKTQGDMAVCGVASNLGEARELLEGLRPDLVVLDLELGGGNGLGLLKRYRDLKTAAGREVRFLVLTAHDEVLLGPRAFSAGARGFVSKQAPLEQVCEAATVILNGGEWFSAATGVLTPAGQSMRRASGIESLTDRELEVFNAIGDGLSTHEIAARLSVSAKTVESHKDNIKAKLGLASANALLRHAVQWTLEGHAVG